MSKKIMWVLVLILGIFLVIKGFTINDANSAEKKEVKRIGVILPLSGPKAYLGVTARKAAEISLNKLNKAAKKYKYEIVFEDDQMESKRTALAYNKLVNIDKVDTIVSWSSNSGNVVSPLAEKNKIVHFGMGVDKKPAIGKYNFTNWSQPEDFMYKMTEQFNKNKIKNISLVYLNHSGPKAMRDEFIKQVNKANMNLVSLSSFAAEERNYRQEISKILASNPDIVTIFLYSPGFEVFTKQLRELGYKGDITTVFYANFVTDKSIIKDMWYVDNLDLEENFKKELAKRTGNDASFGASNIYDIIAMLGQGFENLSDGEELVDVIMKIKKFNGVSGKLTQDSEGIFHSQTIIKRVK